MSYDVTSYHSKGMGVLKIGVGFATYLYIPFGQSKYRTNLVMQQCLPLGLFFLLPSMLAMTVVTQMGWVSRKSTRLARTSSLNASATAFTKSYLWPGGCTKVQSRQMNDSNSPSDRCMGPECTCFSSSSRVSARVLQERRTTQHCTRSYLQCVHSAQEVGMAHYISIKLTSLQGSSSHFS